MLLFSPKMETPAQQYVLSCFQVAIDSTAGFITFPTNSHTQLLVAPSPAWGPACPRLAQSGWGRSAGTHVYSFRGMWTNPCDSSRNGASTALQPITPLCFSFVDPSLTVRADITGRYSNRLYAYEPSDTALRKCHLLWPSQCGIVTKAGKAAQGPRGISLTN